MNNSSQYYSYERDNDTSDGYSVVTVNKVIKVNEQKLKTKKIREAGA
jgi:hypothetical protein